MAEAVVNRGFLHNYSILLAEPHSSKHRITQCYKCLGYGHTSAHCRMNTRCGNCAGNHATKDCTATKKKCANCNGTYAA